MAYNLDEIKTLKENTIIGKIPLRDGRYFVLTAQSRLPDGSGRGVYLDLVDKNGNDVPLAVLTDSSATREDDISLLCAEHPYQSTEMEYAKVWEYSYLEAGEKRDKEQKS